MKFLIGILKMGVDPHVMCFLDVAKALAASLRALGHEVEYMTQEAVSARPGRMIFFGANNSTPAVKIPDDTIIFNTEQVASVQDPRKFMGSMDFWKKYTVWDYSRANQTALLAHGMGRIVHCPVGYVPQMSTIESAAEQDVDVLYYGSVNPRRERILRMLQAAGLRVERLFGVYGEARDEVIARSKVVLNLHFYENAVFEVFRCSHLWANRKCVVTEDGRTDPELEALAKSACVYVPYEQVVDTCRRLIINTSMRREVEERGFAAFKKINFVESVQHALELL